MSFAFIAYVSSMSMSISVAMSSKEVVCQTATDNGGNKCGNAYQIFEESFLGI